MSSLPYQKKIDQLVGTVLDMRASTYTHLDMDSVEDTCPAFLYSILRLAELPICPVKILC